MEMAATKPRITFEKLTGLFVLHVGGPGRPLIISRDKHVLESFLDYLENRTASDSLSLASEPPVDSR